MMNVFIHPDKRATLADLTLPGYGQCVRRGENTHPF
jgi:hypothetical protein